MTLSYSYRGKSYTVNAQPLVPPLDQQALQAINATGVQISDYTASFSCTPIGGGQTNVELLYETNGTWLALIDVDTSRIYGGGGATVTIVQDVIETQTSSEMRSKLFPVFMDCTIY